MSESSNFSKMKKAEINYQNLITLLRWNAWAIHRSWSLIFTIEKLNCTSALHVFDIETFNLFQNEQKVTQLLLRANWCRTIKVCASFDLSAIERTRQIKLLLIRVFVDCFYVEISLKQNASKQVKRFDYLSLFTPPLCLLWRRCFKRSTVKEYIYVVHTNAYMQRKKNLQQIGISVCRSEAAGDAVLVHLSDTWIGENASHIFRCFLYIWNIYSFVRWKTRNWYNYYLAEFFVCSFVVAFIVCANFYFEFDIEFSVWSTLNGCI